MKRSQGKDKLLPVITLNKKYLSKQVVTITYTLAQKSFANATVQGFVTGFYSDRIKKHAAYLICMILLWVSREDKTNWTCMWYIKLINDIWESSTSEVKWTVVIKKMWCGNLCKFVVLI